jgi:segregation and condensation protein B
MNLEQKIESYLFFKNEPVSKKDLAKFFEVSEEEVSEALGSLKESLSGRGIQLVMTEFEAILATAPEMSALFEQMRKDELSRELSKASLETLAIIFYKNGATRAEIEYIRGVQSSFILRNLTVRGLVEKTTHKDDSRKIIYKPTLDTIRFLGINDVSMMPSFNEFNALLLGKEKELEIEVEKEAEGKTDNS